MAAKRADAESITEFFNDRLNGYLIGIPAMILIYTSIEALSKGRSLGKVITGTVAVESYDLSRIGWKKAFLRSLCRMIPFEPLSGFGANPWHDSMTHTMVIKKQKNLPV